MRDLLIVGSGSFIGGICRYYLSGLVAQTFAIQTLPIGTFIVNSLGCLIIGLVGGVADVHQILTPSTRLFLMTGLMGGFTTFSAFSYETLMLMRADRFGVALLNAVFSIICGVLAVWMGFRIIQFLSDIQFIRK